jgi:hemolysin III
MTNEATVNSSSPSSLPAKVKPLLRGHFHQGAFYFTMGACAMLIAGAQGPRAMVATVIYSICISTLFGISALYHRPMWEPGPRTLMKRLDHAAIFLMIAGTATPISMLALSGENGNKLMAILWAFAFFGVMQSLFWVKAPRWLSAILYVIMGWLSVPYLGEMKVVLGESRIWILLAGGVVYTVGAVIYATKKPNPWPKYFGYHEVFHILVIVAAVLHFIVVSSLILAGSPVS